MEYNDDLLIYYIHLNNRTAYDILYAKYYNLTKIILYTKLNFKYVNKSEFEDILQDCILLFNKSIYTYRNEEGTFYMYYSSVIYNVFLSNVKELYNRKTKTIFECEYEDNDSSLFNYLSDSMDYSENYSLREERKFLINQGKTDLENKVVYLKQEGYTYKEITLLLGVSNKKIDYILSNSKKKLKKFYD